jgi:hypothetical protein
VAAYVVPTDRPVSVVYALPHTQLPLDSSGYVQPSYDAPHEYVSPSVPAPRDPYYSQPIESPSYALFADAPAYALPRGSYETSAVDNGAYTKFSSPGVAYYETPRVADGVYTKFASPLSDV